MADIPTHPVQVRQYGVRDACVPQTVSLRAYEVYCHVYGPQEAMVSGNCRGGFWAGELIALLYAHGFKKEQWRARVDEARKGMNL